LKNFFWVKFKNKASGNLNSPGRIIQA
jgi:hypothetical protein